MENDFRAGKEIKGRKAFSILLQKNFPKTYFSGLATRTKAQFRSTNRLHLKSKA
jgi:hypothetical protein